MKSPCTGSPLGSWVDGHIVIGKVGRSVQLMLLRQGKHPSKLTSLPRPIPEIYWGQSDTPAGYGARQGGGSGTDSMPAAARGSSAAAKFEAIRARVRAKERAIRRLEPQRLVIGG